MNENAADVIARGVRKAGEDAKKVHEQVWPNPQHTPLSLKAIASQIDDVIGRVRHLEHNDLLPCLYHLAKELRARHDHADPCDDEYCPCYKAARDWMRDQRGDRP